MEEYSGLSPLPCCQKWSHPSSLDLLSLPSAPRSRVAGILLTVLSPLQAFSSSWAMSAQMWATHPISQPLNPSSLLMINDLYFHLLSVTYYGLFHHISDTTFTNVNSIMFLLNHDLLYFQSSHAVTSLTFPPVFPFLPVLFTY